MCRPPPPHLGHDGFFESPDEVVWEDSNGLDPLARDARLGHTVVVRDEVVLVLLALELVHLCPHLVHVSRRINTGKFEFRG